MKMTGKPYREYYHELDKQAYNLIDRHSPGEASQIAAQMRQAAAQSGEKK